MEYRQLNLLRTEESELKSTLRRGVGLFTVGAPLLALGVIERGNSGWLGGVGLLAAGAGFFSTYIGAASSISAKVDLARLRRGKAPLNMNEAMMELLTLSTRRNRS